MAKQNLVLLLLALPIAACSDATAPRVPTSLELSQASLALSRFDTTTVTAMLIDQRGNPYKEIPGEYAVTWSTSDPDVATVEDGLVTAVGTGSATLTARAGSLPPVTLPLQVSPRAYSGQLTFNYSGHRSGAFSVSSTYRFTAQEPDAASYAYSFYDGEYDSQDIFAVRERPDGLLDVLHFWVDGRVSAPGTRAASDGMLFLGLAAESVEDIYWVVSGSVQVSVASDGRLAGSFALAAEHAALGSTLDIAGGTFDLSVVPGAEFEDEVGGSPGAAVSSRTMFAHRLHEVIAAPRSGNTVPTQR